MEEAPPVNKRLAFEDFSQQLTTQQLDVDDVIKALKNPSVDNFNTALNLMQQGWQARFDAIQETAKEQSAAVGEADHRRLKRQFTSLKNTFLHYSVKDEFIAALADGLPNGTEDIQLAQFEEEANRNIATLRGLKARNEEAQNEMSGLINQINDTLEQMKHRNIRAASSLSRLAMDIAAAEAAEKDMPPPLADGPDEAECQALLVQEAAEARDLEAKIVAQLTELRELEASLPAEREETGVATAVLADLQDQRAALGGDAAVNTARFASSAAWAEEAGALLSSLGGLTVSMVDEKERMLTLHITTAYPVGPVSNGSLGICEKGSHELSLVMNTKNVVVDGALTPTDIDMSDIIDAAIAGSKGVDFVVREVRGRLSGYLHRKALATMVQERFSAVKVDAAAMGYSVPTEVHLTTPSTSAVPVTLQVVMEECWPGGDDVARVAGVQVEEQMMVEEGRIKEAMAVIGNGPLDAVETALLVLEKV